MIDEKKLAVINARKNEIQNAANKLVQTCWGYFTRIDAETKAGAFDCESALKLADELYAYHDQMEMKYYSYTAEFCSEQEKLYKSFLVSSILFLKNECSEIEFNFNSLIKIAAVTDEGIEDKMQFDHSFYAYLLNDSSKRTDTAEYNCLSKAYEIFSELYEDARVTKEHFFYNIENMIDSYLYEHQYSRYLLGENRPDGVDMIERFIGMARYQMTKE